MQPNLLPSEHTREALRTITGGMLPGDISFRASDLYAHYDRLRDEAIIESERRRNLGLKFCGDHRQVEECNQLHEEEVADIRAAHARSIAEVQKMERRQAHARHETRDERGEAAAEAARAAEAAEGGRLL